MELLSFLQGVLNLIEFTFNIFGTARNDIFLRTSESRRIVWEPLDENNYIKIKNEIPGDLLECENKKIVYTTLLVLCYLHKYFSDKYREWKLIEKKAVLWLKKNSVIFSEHKDTILGYLA